MKFWDSSALAPLLVHEKDSPRREQQLVEDPEILVWYSTPAELASVLASRQREGMPINEVQRAEARLTELAKSWFEVQPTPTVRDRTVRLIRVHPLRAADAFQLAAALAAFQERPEGQVFYTGDQRLKEAAHREGFAVG